MRPTKYPFIINTCNIASNILYRIYPFEQVLRSDDGKLTNSLKNCSVSSSFCQRGASPIQKARQEQLTQPTGV